MCGIAGIVGIKDKQFAASKISVMTESLKHRGPDANAVFVNDEIALGHVRLSIIDLSDSANQPFHDFSKRFSIIYNGEIYNFLEVKQQLKDYPFRTNSDTEVILAAYQKYGIDCLSHFNGMFSFAIWDNLKKELFCARDRVGVKPFFYAQTSDELFLFSSEIRSILKTELVPKLINEAGLYDYVMFQSVYAPQTIVKGIYQLQAGEFGIFSNGRFDKKSYWRIEDEKKVDSLGSEAEIKKNVRELLLKSVERRLISDVELGAFLSGGIDSSAIVAIMSEVSDKTVNTFSINFAEKKFDESKFSNLIAQKYKTNHTSVCLTADNFLHELPNALSAADSPSGDGINSYVVAKETRKTGIKVAVSGLGGDELFAGYPNFLKYYKTQNGIFSKIPHSFRKSIAKVMTASKNSKTQRLGNFIGAENTDIASIYLFTRQVMSQQMTNSLFTNSFHETQIEKNLSEISDKINQFPVLSQFSIAEIKGYTQNVLLKDIDQFSMAVALEVREPFFDYKLIEYVLQIPDKYKYPKYPKSLLVEAIYPSLPNVIIHRPKMGFVLPWENWMRNELKEFCQVRINEFVEREILDSAKILSKWRDFLSGKNGVLWSHLWHLVVLTEWLKNNKF